MANRLPYSSRRPSFFHHLHPPTIPASQARFRYTLGAGGISAFLMIVIVVTGILEMFYYVPIAASAATSIQIITYLVPFGSLIRNLHYLSAQLLVIVAGIHLLRVIFTGAYSPPRRFNYLLGLGLFVCILLLDFSGYVLRWDEGIHWALVVGTNLIHSIPMAGPALYRIVVGSSQINEATLIRFYTWHIFGLTILVAILFGWHIFRVRRDGGIAVAPANLRQNQERITRFELVRREGLAALIVLSLLVILSLLIPAPLASPLNLSPSLSSDANAPWFFLWVQQMLKWGDPFLFGIAIPVGIILFLGLIPYIFPHPKPGEQGHWFPAGNRLARISVSLVFLMIMILTTIALWGKS